MVKSNVPGEVFGLSPERLEAPLPTERRVLTVGSFDLFHLGHLRFLQGAASLGPLTVGVNSDEFIREHKGHDPVVPHPERCEIIRALGYEVFLNSELCLQESIEELGATVLAVGTDWDVSAYLDRTQLSLPWLRAVECQLVFLPYTDGISTSDRIAEIVARHG